MTAQEVRAEKFTPGPWVAHTFAVYADDGGDVAHTGGTRSRTRGGNEEQIANARLIAAAPSMYAALTRAHVVIRDAITLRVPIDGDAEGTLKVVEAALRLALDGAA